MNLARTSRVGAPRVRGHGTRGGPGRLVLATLAVAFLAAAGCTHVVRVDAPYYRDDPYEALQPSGWIEQGTYVTWLGNRGQYARVLSGDGVAYLLSSDLVGVFTWWQRQAREKSAEDESKPRKVLFEQPPATKEE